MKPVLPLALALLAAACSRSTAPGEVASDAATTAIASAEPCTPAVAEKLGVPFVRICAAGPGIGSVASPFWISALPIGCSAGEHDTLRCPPVVALAQPRQRDPEGLRPGASSLAAVVEADTAHRVCSMRFAGRLPTRAERSLARTALGLATVMVTDLKDRGAVRLQELGEWVTEKSCDQPTVLPADCGASSFPWEASAGVPWDSVVRCEVTPLAERGGRITVGVESECTGVGAAAGAGATRLVPCLVRGPAVDPRGQRVEGVSLACSAPAAAPRASDINVDVAAFRCVLPAWL